VTQNGTNPICVKLTKETSCPIHQYFKSSFFVQSFLRSFYVLTIGFVIFWQTDIGAKAAHKMLVKLTPVAQFTNQ
jgi:hypothetical protein